MIPAAVIQQRDLRLATAIALLLVATVHAQDTIHVTKTGSPAPTGEVSDPFQSVEAGIVKTLTTTASTVEIAAGLYYETFTTEAPCTLTAGPGDATIGRMDYQAATTVEFITLNTHLFGDVIGPSWMDYERAEDIADYFGGPNPWPDVVGFQEIWDEDLFWGGDGAEGIWPATGYAYGEHGDESFGDPVNSGLALLSAYELTGFAQIEWNECIGFTECSTAKGWLQATVTKDGISFGVYCLHAQAGSYVFDADIRRAQMIQLRDSLIAYRAANPTHALFVVGDFNIYGEDVNAPFPEYHTALIENVGNQAGGRDGARNAPGFVPGSPATWTLCDCNPLAMYFDDETVSGRLDYIFYFPSLDGTVEVVPNSVVVRPFTGRTLSDDGLTTDQSSDHWSAHGVFTLVRP